MKKKFLCAGFICILFSALLFSLTRTGTVIVKVKNAESGEPLSGADVILSSDQIVGTRTAVTDAGGRAVFRNLPPGEYSIGVTLPGFQITEARGIRVHVQRTTLVPVQMKIGEMSDVVTVTGAAELVDAKSNTLSSEFNFDQYINHMPVARHYTQIASLAGGVLAAGDPSVFGAGAYDNLYLIDGVFAIDSRTQTWGGQFNMDIVQDMSLQTAGISAEYGHATGSVFNIVTKSGTNELHGIARLEMYRAAWNDTTMNNPARDDDDRQLGDNEDRWNFSGGGPIVPDLAWWYVGYTEREMLTDWQRRQNPFDTGELTDAVTGYIGHLFSIKGTVKPADGLKCTVLYKEDPISIGNAGSYKYFGDRTQPEADTVQRQGGSFVLVNAAWIFGEDTMLEARWTDYHEELDVTAQEAHPDGYWRATETTGESYISSDNWFWGVYPYESLTDRNHDAAAAAVNWLMDTESLGKHDLKIGLEYLDEWCVIRNSYFPGGAGVFTGDVEGVGFDNTPYLQKIEIINRLPEAEEHIRYWSFYAQDSAEVSESITLNIGIRSDLSSAENNREEKVFSSSPLDALAPRIGLALAIGDGGFRLSYGRYCDLFSMYIIDYFNTFPFPEVWTLYEPVDGSDGRNGWEMIYQWTEGDAVSPHSLSEDLTPQYMDEISAGFDFPLSKNMAVSISGVWRVYKDLIITQDIDGDQYYNIENLATDRYGGKWKEHLGFVLELRKRPANDRLFLSASLTYSSTEGLSSDTLTTGLGSYANNPLQRYDNAEEWWGPIPTLSFLPDAYAEPTLMAKLQTVYMLPEDYYIGLIMYWHNGFLPTTYDETLVQGFGIVKTFPNGRGDMERLPPQFNIDLQFGIESEIELPFDIPLSDDSVLLGIYLNIRNLLNEQVTTGVEQYVNSPKYSQPTGWNTARSYLLGFRLEF